MIDQKLKISIDKMFDKLMVDLSSARDKMRNLKGYSNRGLTFSKAFN